MLYFMGCMFFSNFSCQPCVINIQLRNTDNICTDLYILLKPQSQLGYLGSTKIEFDLASYLEMIIAAILVMRQIFKLLS